MTPPIFDMPLLELKEISKSFTGTRALRDISFSVEPGEIVGLIGENGAGKSTLIKILSGVHRPDAGDIFWNGGRADFQSPREAMLGGIATIHQELATFEKLTVAENLLLGERWPRYSCGGTNWPALNKIAADRLSLAGLDTDPRAFFHELSAAQRQEIAIARALSSCARLVILDEPTASLTEPEVEKLIGQLAQLKRNGIAILYVSHRLDEILKLADRVLVLRDGQLAAQYPAAEATIPRMIRDMVGRELRVSSRRAAKPRGRAVFSTQNLTHEDFRDITLQVHAGEILGLSGLIGAGRSELARAIFGLYQPASGAMRLNGTTYQPKSAAEAKRVGIVYVPEERKRQGLVLDHSIRSSISIALVDRLSRIGWIRSRNETHLVKAAATKFQIKHRSIEQPVGTLSGGNQQKALLARWLEMDPNFIILDEPTRGVDVGAKAEIHRLISSLAEQGKAILLISSDLPELLTLSDRIVVLHRGRTTAEFEAAVATQEDILLAASGFRSQSK
jgi:rhamnose transport system ATP-binding protein